jgi:hypothetical protein
VPIIDLSCEISYRVPVHPACPLMLVCIRNDSSELRPNSTRAAAILGA